MPKKKFIDKKHSTTFVLGHRSQRDPLVADESAPQNILIPLDQVPDLSKGGVSAATAGGGNSSKQSDIGDKQKRIEEQRKYGVYFDDDYDYLQHLKDSNEVSTIKWDVVERIYAPNIQHIESQSVESTEDLEDLKDVKIKLPSSVFESEYKEDVGLLNKTAQSFGPRPDLDPDVIAALDEDFDHEDPENVLEDNFVELAKGAAEAIDREPTAEELEGLFSDEEEDNEGGKSDEADFESDYEDEEADSVGSLDGPQYSFRDEETKSHFTNYSMTSSVIRRNKQLLLVDDRFEKMFESYEDTEIGALDCDEIEGDINPESELLLKYAEEFEKDKKQEEELNSKIASMVVKEESSENESMSDYSDEDDQPKEKWDCQSIISTYSTTKNRPKIIREASKRNPIKVSGRTGIPVGVLGKGGLTKDNLKMLNAENSCDAGKERAKSIMSGATSIRNKNETPQERRERKLVVKEYRRERRLEKKANSDAFKEEKKRIEKVRLNNKANVQGLKL